MESGPEFLVALQRLQSFLVITSEKRNSNLDDGNLLHGEACLTEATTDRDCMTSEKIGGKLLLDHVNISWPQNDFCIDNIQLNISSPQLIAIVGPVGAGKSSLLSAILGESTCKPAAYVHGRIAYSPQQPWVFSGTLRDNITFFEPFDILKYQRVIDACALVEDIASLSHGEETEIGERGVNLSGGQKARVGLARCLYSEAHILLLDDPLAAVDANVALHLFHHAILPMSHRSIVLLVTHHPHFAAMADSVLVVECGHVRHISASAYITKCNKATSEDDFVSEHNICHLSRSMNTTLEKNQAEVYQLSASQAKSNKQREVSDFATSIMKPAKKNSSQKNQLGRCILVKDTVFYNTLHGNHKQQWTPFVVNSFLTFQIIFHARCKVSWKSPGLCSNCANFSSFLLTFLKFIIIAYDKLEPLSEKFQSSLHVQ